MRRGCRDRDDLPDDLTELEELRATLYSSLFALQKKIKQFSDELGKNYSDSLNNGGAGHYLVDNDLIMMSNNNDGLLNEYSDMDDRISRVEKKIDSIKKDARDI